jgi:anti-sigma factor RsiW
MRVTCREVAELLIDFIDGELPEMKRLTLQQHICACPPCMFYLETYQTTIEVTHTLPDEPLPPEFEARLRAVMEKWEAEEGEELGEDRE